MANPHKSAEVEHILGINKERLLKYLGDFHAEKGESLTDSIENYCKTFELFITELWLSGATDSFGL